MSIKSVAELVGEAAHRTLKFILIVFLVLLFWFVWGVSKVYKVLCYASHPIETVKEIRLIVIRSRGSRPPVALSRSRRSLTLPLRPQQEDTQRQQQCHDQLQSVFFTKLAPEIRCMIYREILGPSHALHVWRTHRRLCSMPCRQLGRETHHDRGLCYRPCADDGTVLRRLPEETPRQDQILALLCSCRRLYSEAIGLLYEANTFDFDDPLTVQALPLCMVPHRLASIRRIRLDCNAFQNGDILADVSSSWEQACTVLAGIEALEELFVTLRPLDKETLYKELPLLTLLRPLPKITARRFIVEVPPHDDPEQLAGGLGVVPFTLQTKEFFGGKGSKYCTFRWPRGAERPWWFPPAPG